MRTFLTLLVGILLSWSNGAQAESRECWSSAVCYKAENIKTEWLKIFPRINCTSNSNLQISEAVEYIRIQQKFNHSIVEFFKGLGEFAKKKCSSCNSHQGIEVDGSRYTYSEECFAPVVCSVDKGTIANYIQVRPFPSCRYGNKEMERLFNSSREYVAKELQHFLFENCNLCQTTRIENAIATLTKSLWKPSIDTKQCYAPVICTEGDNSFKNWMQFPYPGCKSAYLLLSEKPEKIFSFILERARAEIQDIMEVECSKSCDKKSPFSTTTPEILQRASIKSADKGTTSAVLESMLETSTTSKSMWQISTTSPKTTLDSSVFLLRSYNFPKHSIGLDINGNPSIVQEQEFFRIVSPGLQGTPGTVSFESIRFPGRYLKNSGFLLYLHAYSNPDDELFQKNATYWPRESRFFPGFTAYESFNYPRYFMRHQGYRLKISTESEYSDLFKKDASFLPLPVPTSKEEFETSQDTTTQEATTAGCTALENNSKTCNITYGGKCFILWNSDVQNVDLQKANKYCAMHGFQLGNIYDDCLFSLIMNQVGDNSVQLWTGMTFAFEKENPQVYLHSNETAKFLPKWWYDGYPKNDGSKNLLIQIKLKVFSSPPSYPRGIGNSPASAMAMGALCEKDVNE